MVGLRSLGFAVALAVWAGGGASAVGAIGEGPLAFKGAQLGETLQRWQSLDPPASAGPTAKPVCWRDERIIRLAGFAQIASIPTQGAVLCTYASKYGDRIVADSVKLAGGYRGNDLRYLFVDGRLARIRVRASADAYNDVVALLQNEYGAPSSTLRDTIKSPAGRLQRVRKRWLTPGGSVAIFDPSGNRDELSLRYSTAAARTP